MRLAELVDGWAQVSARHEAVEILHLTCDSRLAEAGSLFVAVNGARADGLSYAGDAIRRGAVAVLCPKDSRVRASSRELGVPVLRVADVRATMAHVGSVFFGAPSRRLEVVGVTGTKGKTTTTWLVDRIFRVAGRRTGLFGTVENRVGDATFEASNTTAGCLDLQRWCHELVDVGGTHATIEVSSHALEQKRTAEIDFDCAVFTNIAPEHLDYHGTMDRYLATKTLLFSQLRASAVAVLPRDEAAAQYIARHTRANIRWYGCEPEDGVTCLTMSSEGSEFTWHGTRMRTTLWGLFNLENAFAAMTAAECCGIDRATIAEAMREPVLPPGRLEEVRYRRPAPFRVVVDYAHTDGSLQAVLETLRPMTSGRLITVFGCGGDRDASKRPRMGRVAENGSDRVIVTSDNPRSELPKRILDDIVSGLAKPLDAVVLDDRRDAIALGIRMAQPGDTVLIAGKGHETYQEIDGHRFHFDDREVAREFLQEVLETAMT